MSLLIHSMGEFESIILPALDIFRPARMVEIGSEHGGLTTLVNQWACDHGAHLTSVDPAPSDAFKRWAQSAQSFTHIARPSLEAFEALNNTDVWFIDGDHNWYTVYHELQNIHVQCQRDNKPLLAFIHDVGWPSGRRDSYYQPDRIPEKYRQPFSYEGGVIPGVSGMVQDGFNGMGQFAYACHEGGERNGVLTAVEDFYLSFDDEFILALIPAVFGLGVLFSQKASWAAELAEHLVPYHQNDLLQRLEMNRLRNYLKVIEMQNEAAAKR